VGDFHRQGLEKYRASDKIKERIAVEGFQRPFLLEAEAVSQANNMFWLLTDSMTKRKDCGKEYVSNSESGSGDDLEKLYREWEIWFENYASQISEPDRYRNKKIIIRGRE
jgi:hypothetical protein